MTLERAHALAALRIPTTQRRIEIKLPHSNRLVQTPADQMVAIRTKRHRVHRIAMAVFAFRPFDHGRGLRVPDPHALVERAGSDIAVVRRDRHGGDAVFDLQREDALVLLDVPEADGAVAGAGGDVTSVGSKVQAVDVLFVAGELVTDDLVCDVPDL